MIWKHCNPPCLPKDLNPAFLACLEKMDLMIHDRGFGSLCITSAFRSVDYEKSKGRPGTSSHCKGLAVDVSCRDLKLRHAIVDICSCVGIPRIGIYKTFLHLDVDFDKVNPCIWLGD